MIFNGKVHLREIERAPIELQATESDAWVQTFLQKSAPATEISGMTAVQWAGQAKMDLDIRLEKVAGDFLLTAHGKGLVPALCSHCAEPFMAERQFDVCSVIVPVSGSQKRLSKDEEPESSEDPDYILIRSESLDLTDVLSEHLIILEPIAEHPKERRPGDCPLCGDLVEAGLESTNTPPVESTMARSSLERTETVKNSPFSTLASLKDQLKK